MKQIECLIEALRTAVVHKALMGVGSKILVCVASQNVSVVKKAVGEIAYGILRRQEWNTSNMDDAEINIRSEGLLKDLFYTKRIIIDIEQKPYPNADGNYLDIHSGSHERVFYDLDNCQEAMMLLGLGNPE
jgi:hypothetical protein